MQREENTRTVALILLLTILVCSRSIHSCKFASSPSPSPAIAMPRLPEPSSPEGYYRKPKRSTKGYHRKPKRGSFPAICYAKCNDCEPCMPVPVVVRQMELEENEYYPLVWKCACNDNIFSP